MGGYDGRSRSVVTKAHEKDSRRSRSVCTSSRVPTDALEAVAAPRFSLPLPNPHIQNLLLLRRLGLWVCGRSEHFPMFSRLREKWGKRKRSACGSSTYPQVGPKKNSRPRRPSRSPNRMRLRLGFGLGVRRQSVSAGMSKATTVSFSRRSGSSGRLNVNDSSVSSLLPSKLTNCGCCSSVGRT